MKKTIAKIMAAAMVLSAVPAVAVPSLTAEAATQRYYSGITLNVDGSEQAVTLDTQYARSVVTPATAPRGDWFIYTVDKSVAGVESISDHTIVTNISLGGAYNTNGLAASFSNSMTKGEAKTYFGAEALDEGTNEEYVKSASFNSDGYLEVVLNDNATVNKALSEREKTAFTVPIEIYTNDDVLGVTDKKDSTTYYAEEAYIDFDLKVGNTIDTKTTYIAKAESGNIKVEISLDASGNASIVKDQYTKYSATDLEAQKGETLDITTAVYNGVPYPVTKVESRAFKGCKFKKVIAKNAKNINGAAFRKCKQMKSINLCEDRHLRKIHSKAFYDCKKLATIKVDGRKLKEVGSAAFQGVKSNCTIKVKGNKTQYNNAVKKLKKGVKGTKVKFARI